MAKKILDVEMIAMTLIGYAGETKSLAYQAMSVAKEGKFDVGLIMVHSQDHLMTAILFKELAKEFIDIYKRLGQK